MPITKAGYKVMYFQIRVHMHASNKVKLHLDNYTSYNIQYIVVPAQVYENAC